MRHGRSTSMGEHRMTPIDNDVDLPWHRVAADVLESDIAEIAGRAADTSFTMLGGTSLRAIEFTALLSRHNGLTVPVGALLGPAPLAAVMSTAEPAESAPPALPGPPVDQATRPATPVSHSAGDGNAPVLTSATGAPALEPARVQQAMLFSEQLYGGT